jgi:hypothetical protein
MTDPVPSRDIADELLEAVTVLDEPFHREAVAGLLGRAAGLISRLRSDQEDHDHSFNLRWKADMRAIERWQEAHPGNELTWPDHADLCVWLLEENERLRTTLTGISTCSTCEACRGAAQRALGDEPQRAWQPIATIPSGEWVLLDCGNAGIVEGVYSTHEDGQLGYWDSYGNMVHSPLHWIALDALPDTPSQPPGDGQ